MAVNGYVSHTSLDGRTFDQRIRDAGYTGSFPLGENVAAGQSSPEAVVNAFMSSAEHCRGIMDPGFRAVGIGYALPSRVQVRPLLDPGLRRVLIQGHSFHFTTIGPVSAPAWMPESDCANAAAAAVASR